MIENKVAKKAIKALVVMTTDDNGKLIPAENSVKYHWNLDGPPYWGKNYNAVYLEEKVSLRYNAYEPEKRIDIDSHKNGHLAEYRSNITEYTLFGKNAGQSRPINKNGINLYYCTIPKGACYDEVESGEVIASNIVLGEKYIYPKRFMHLQVGDEVWAAIYRDYREYDKRKRYFEFLAKTKITEIVEHKIDLNNCYNCHINVNVEGSSRTFYLNPYRTTMFDNSGHIGGAMALSLTREGLIDSFTDSFGKWIKCKMEVIEECEKEISEAEKFIDAVKNCK
jgi:hypothetical protein